METMAKGFDAQGLVRLDEKECWHFLRSHFLGRVALVHLGDLMVFPVNYAVVSDRWVVFRTAPGTKLALAGTGVRVAFEVDEAVELFETGTSVVVHGTMHQVHDRQELSRLSELPVRAWAPGDRDHIVRIDPIAVTGRRIPMHSEDDGLLADGG